MIKIIRSPSNKFVSKHVKSKKVLKKGIKKYNANIGISSLDSSVEVIYRQDGEGSGMHNKVVIGDAEYTESAFVLTGSTNMTTGNLNTDKNNVIVIEDQSLARGYTLEFNEMWGSDTFEPDLANSKFGPDKTINTPKKFIIINFIYFL